jgi:hypothetical protein
VPSQDWLKFEGGVISSLSKQTRIGVSAPTEITPWRRITQCPPTLGRLNRPVNQSFTRSHCRQIDAPDNENESRTFMSGKNIPYAPGSFRNRRIA